MQAAPGLAMIPGVDGAALSWRDKYPRKGLYFQRGPEAAPVNLADTRLEGSLGSIRTLIELSVPETEIKGVKVKKDRQKTGFMDLWVFVDGDWLRQHRSEIGNRSLTRY